MAQISREGGLTREIPKDVIQKSVDMWINESGLEIDEIADYLPRFTKYAQGESDENRDKGFRKGYSDEDFATLIMVIKSHPKMESFLKNIEEGSKFAGRWVRGEVGNGPDEQ